MKIELGVGAGRPNLPQLPRNIGSNGRKSTCNGLPQRSKLNGLLPSGAAFSKPLMLTRYFFDPQEIPMESAFLFDVKSISLDTRLTKSDLAALTDR
jgi:hypothetical protein